MDQIVIEMSLPVVIIYAHPIVSFNDICIGTLYPES
jgi:hypothetical protein